MKSSRHFSLISDVTKRKTWCMRPIVTHISTTPGVMQTVKLRLGLYFQLKKCATIRQNLRIRPHFSAGFKLALMWLWLCSVGVERASLSLQRTRFHQRHRSHRLSSPCCAWKEGTNVCFGITSANIQQIWNIWTTVSSSAGKTTLIFLFCCYKN